MFVEKVVWTNDSVLQILGTTKSQVVGKSVSTWVIDQTDNLYQEALDACIDSGHPFTIRELKLGRGEQTSTVDASFSQIPITHNDDPVLIENKPILLIEISQVDQPLKIARDSKYATDENNLKKILRGLAHEVKNPLGGIKRVLHNSWPKKQMPQFSKSIFKSLFLRLIG